MAKETLETSLRSAIFENNLKKATELIESGANVNYVYQGGHSPLMFAVIKGNVQMSQLLIDNGADINRHDDLQGKTALHDAVISGNFPLIKLLLIKGADVDRVDFSGSRSEYYARNNPRIKEMIDLARQNAFKEELSEMFDEAHLMKPLYEFHKDSSFVPMEDVEKTQERMTRIKKEAMTVKEAMLGKEVIALEDIGKKDRGRHVPVVRGGAGSGRGGRG